MKIMPLSERVNTEKKVWWLIKNSEVCLEHINLGIQLVFTSLLNMLI